MFACLLYSFCFVIYNKYLPSTYYENEREIEKISLNFNAKGDYKYGL